MATPTEVTIESHSGEPTVGTATHCTTIAAVSIKLPPFWPADPTVWFAQVKAQFNTRGITSLKTRFDYMITSLSPEFAVEVRDLLIRPPAEEPYDTLRAEWIKRTAASEQRKLQQLISGENLSDRKPTQLLQRMQQLLGDHLGPAADNSFLNELFLQRLLLNMCMVLASADEKTVLAKLSDNADKVIEVAAPSMSAITCTSSDVEMEKPTGTLLVPQKVW